MRKIVLSDYFRLLLLSVLAQTSEAGIRYINLSPIIGQLPQVSYPEPGSKKAPYARYMLHAASANYFSSANHDDLSYKIDGETATIQQTFELGLESGLIGITNRWFKHSPGSMDSMIYDFHDMFGMPQNGRTKASNEQIDWLIEANNQDVYTLNRSSSGFGDTSLFYELRGVKEIPNLRLEISIPSSRTTKRTSTDTWGLSVSSSLMGPELFADQDYLPSLNTWFGFGATALHNEDTLDAINLNPLVASFVAGAIYNATDSWDFEAQLNTNSPYFDSEIRELGWVPIIASFASGYQFDSAKAQLGFSQDLRPGTSPDFSVFFSFNYDF